jgi:mannose-6-phosphate isomerase-like protein (cupin superfamily)
MARRGDELFNPATRTRIVFLSVPADNGGRELTVDWFVPPGETLPAAAHYHAGPPGEVAERFEVIAGTASLKVGGRTVKLTAPDGVDIGFNQLHTHPANTGDSELHVRQIGLRETPEPEMFDRIERFFETLIALSQQGKANRKGDITNPLQEALTVNDLLLDPTFLPAAPKGFQRFVFASVAALARRLGYRAYHSPSLSPGQEPL